MAANTRGLNTRMRARDLDRTTAIDALERAYADGQLSFDEHTARVETARTAKTLGELHALISDLQLSTDLPEPPPVRRRPRGRGWVIAGLLVAAAAGALVWAVARAGDDESPTAATTSEEPARPPASVPTDVVAIVAPAVVLDTAAGLHSFVDQYRARFGDTIVADATLYPEDKRAGLTRVVAADREQTISYRGGFEATGTPTSRRVDEPTLDLAAVNVEVLAGLVAEVPQRIGVPDATVSHVTVDARADGPRISIYAANDANESGYVVAGIGGDIREVNAFRR